MSTHLKPDGPPVPDLIRDRLSDLTAAETRVARAVLADFPRLAMCAASVIAHQAGTSPATVVRFAQRIGFAGLPEFHNSVRGGLDHALRSPFDGYSAPAGSATLVAATSVVGIVSDSVGRLTADQVELAVAMINDARRIWVSGGRFSLGLAHTLYAHLNLIRPGVSLLSPTPVPVSDQIVHSGRGELAVIFDFRRYDPNAEFVADYFASNRGSVIVVTDPYLSPAAEHADLTFVVPVEAPGLVDSYVGANAVIEVVVSGVLAHDERIVARRSAAVEDSRRRSDEFAHRRHHPATDPS